MTGQWKVVLTRDGKGSTIEVDGVRLPNVSSITVRAMARERPTIVVTLHPEKVELDAEVDEDNVTRRRVR